MASTFKIPTFKDFVRAAFGERPQPKTKAIKDAPTVPAKELPSWVAYLPDGQCTKGTASTKSEFRAVAKSSLGVKDRLPVGTVIELVTHGQPEQPAA